jgi:hypothetical protein
MLWVTNLSEFRASISQPKIGVIKALSLTDWYANEMLPAILEQPVPGQTRPDLGTFTSLEQIRVCGSWFWDDENKNVISVFLREMTGKTGLQIFFIDTSVFRGRRVKISWE